MGDWADMLEQRAEIEAIKAHLGGAPPRPGEINPLVIKQDVYWWDISGGRHVIDDMDYEYALTVLCFCYAHPDLHDFNWSPLQQKLYAIMKRACEHAWRYEDLD